MGKPTAEDGSLFAIHDEHDVALLEQSEPALFEAEGSTYELLARGRHWLRSRQRFRSS